MASKVPKFGEWEGGQNYTVFFDTARKKKNNGQMINPNDPQDLPEMFQQNGGSAGSVQAPRVDPKQSQAPEFGAWNNGENVAYTEYFEKKWKAKNAESTAITNEPQINRGPPHQARAAPSRPEPQQETRSKVPPFGAWEGGGDVGYTKSFENLRKNNKNGRTVTPEPSSDAPPLNHDASEPAAAKEGRAKVPQFGAWNDGNEDENAAYTAYFEVARKNKNAGPVVPDPIEPQFNRDVNNKPRAPTAAAGTKIKSDDHQLKNSSRGSNSSLASSETPQRPGNQKVRLQQRPPSAGSQTPERGTAIPAWGVWHTDPKQAEGFTGAFTRAKEERNTPLNPNIPQRHNQTQGSPEQKKGCCCGWF